MNAVVEYLYIIFSIIGLYFSFLFILLFYQNKKKMKSGEGRHVELPKVSIIIPAFNEEDNIEGAIRCVKSLNYPKRLLEVIVVDDGSEDSTYENAKLVGGIKLLHQKNKGKASALNLGVSKSTGDIVGCVDADSRPMPDALIKAIPHFYDLGDSSVAGVTTSIFVNNKKKIIEHLQWLEYVMIVFVRKILEFIESIYVTPGAFSLYRKDVLLKLGGFDERVLTEDIEIAWRLLKNGYRIRMSRESRVLTKVPNDVKAWWKQRVRWNIGGLQTGVKYLFTIFKDEFGVLGQFVAPFFILSYVFSIMGLGLFVYLVGNWTYQTFFFTTRAYGLGVDPFAHLEFTFIPDIFTFFGLAMFIMSIFYIAIGIGSVGEEVPESGKLKKLVVLLFYLTLYITFFPINLIYSTWKYFRKDYQW
jgi:cellulose synthase/poly-beta-1,6-N-acetylglucosamine synthase-like glycosyltransferase